MGRYEEDNHLLVGSGLAEYAHGQSELAEFSEFVSRHFAPHRELFFPADALMHLRRRKIGEIYLCRRNFIGAFYGASEIFLTPRKTTV